MSINSTAAKAKETFASLPKHIQKWWIGLNATFKDPIAFGDWVYLSNDQWVAVYEMYTGRYKRITLCGMAGSGKSFVSKFVQRLLEASNKDVLMVASTGIAAYLSGGSTINSAFSMGADNDILPIGLYDKIHHNVKPLRRSTRHEFQIQTRKSIESVVRKVQANGIINKDSKRELIIFFDEIGMFSSENLVIAIQIVHQHFAYTKRKVRFVFLADYRQLLPVDKASETPWLISNSLAIEPAVFETMEYTSNADGITYSTVKNYIPSQLGVVKTENGLTVEGGSIVLSLLTNHRQGEDKEFINNLNAVGDGTASFHPQANNFVQLIANRIYLIDGAETYNWMASKQRKNVLADSKELADATHVYYSNKAVSERNTLGTAAAIEVLRKQFGSQYLNYTRDYGVNIVVSKGESVDSTSRVIQDISPIGITTLSISHPSYKHEKETHSGVASVKGKDIETFAYQRVCVGMRWMCRMNLSAKLKNGTVCTVTYVSDKYFNVVADNDTSKEHIRVEAQTELFVKKNGKGVPIAKVFGVPGHPAYALTYHKTQGITVPKGNPFVLHIDNAMVNFAKKGNMHGLLYVGLSRVETLEQLYIIYEAGVLVEHGMTTMCKTNASVFEFIKYTEAAMDAYLCDEYTHNFITPDPAKTIKEVKKPEIDYFSADPNATISTESKPPLKRLKAL